MSEQKYNPWLLQYAKQAVAKQAFQPAAPPPGGDPAAMGGAMPPGGMPPMDPAAMAAMPGGMPPMDPATMAAMGGMMPGMPPAAPPAPASGGSGSGKGKSGDLEHMSRQIHNMQVQISAIANAVGALVDPATLTLPPAGSQQNADDVVMQQMQQAPAAAPAQPEKQAAIQKVEDVLGYPSKLPSGMPDMFAEYRKEQEQRQKQASVKSNPLQVASATRKILGID